MTTTLTKEEVEEILSAFDTDDLRNPFHKQSAKIAKGLFIRQFMELYDRAYASLLRRLYNVMAIKMGHDPINAYDFSTIMYRLKKMKLIIPVDRTQAREWGASREGVSCCRPRVWYRRRFENFELTRGVFIPAKYHFGWIASQLALNKIRTHEGHALLPPKEIEALLLFKAESWKLIDLKRSEERRRGEVAAGDKKQAATEEKSRSRVVAKWKERFSAP